MRRYIKGWFKKVVNKITNEGKKTVEAVPITAEEIHKRTSMRK
jgi:hypothetical protein